MFATTNRCCVHGVHLVFNLIEDEGVIAKLSQLHNHVAETSSTSLSTLAITDHKLVVGNHLLVKTCLQGRELALNDLLSLVGQILSRHLS
jgi:hypothetical protein